VPGFGVVLLLPGVVPVPGAATDNGVEDGPEGGTGALAGVTSAIGPGAASATVTGAASTHTGRAPAFPAR